MWVVKIGGSLSHDPALRECLGANGRARVVQNFRREPALEAYEALYERALSEPGTVRA